MSEIGSEEIINLSKKNGPERKAVIKDSNYIPDTGSDRKYVVRAHSLINGTEGKRDMSLIFKTLDRRWFKELRDDESAADKYCEFWEQLKKAEIPTVPSIIKLADNKVAMTNLTADGTVLYGKNRFFSNVNRMPTDELFSKIESWEIYNKGREILEKANKAKIVLPKDDPFELLVHPNGSWELIVLDLSQFEHVKEEGQSVGVNNESLSLFTDFLSSIKKRIKGEYK